jgi:hypothetical protein
MTEDRSGLLASLGRVIDGLSAVAAAGVAGALYAVAFMPSSTSAPLRAGLVVLALLSSLVAIFFLLRQIGQISRLFMPEAAGNPGAQASSSTPPAQRSNQAESFSLGWRALRGFTNGSDGRKSMPAPEMVLQQFVQQVRAYAMEKSYQRAKSLPGSDKRTHGTLEPVDLLKRRWNEVLDSLNEFEIYLAGDQRTMIETLVARHPSSLLDVSQIFREVAESFDTTWRRKGINIESAIVTPLKATTSEPILRRILVGPWRACAYLARRGNGVVFSAQSQDGRVLARWECAGVSIPEDYLRVALDDSRSVNERIEIGMDQMSGDPQNTNILFALVSLITWVDLAQATNIEFAFKNTNEGFAISLELV